MPVEIKGSQLRIRVRSPKMFDKFRTLDVGSKGKLQIIRGYKKGKGWMTQAYRLNLKDYKGFKGCSRDIRKLRIPMNKKKLALKKSLKYYLGR